MRSLSMILMFSLGVLFSDASLVQAHNDTFFNSPHKLELKPANSEPAYRLAKSYWLGGADIGLSFEGDDGSTICRAQGYTSDSCIPPLSIIKTCSYNGNYHLCGCDSSVYKYSSQDCPADAEPDGSDTCDGYSRACEAPNCANGGVKCPDGQTCNTATKLCENTARIVPCKVGDTLYSDIHCYEGVPADKKAIAVVFDTTENLAVSLEEQKKHGEVMILIFPV